MPLGLAIPLMIVAFVAAIAGRYRPRMAKFLAPLYAVAEGAVLGAISNLYNVQSHGIVPLAVAGTSAVFIGTLVAYRSGIVTVSNKMIRMVAVGGFALVIVMILAIILNATGVTFAGMNNAEYLIFGPIVLVWAIFQLFVDFEYVSRASKAALSAEGEWYAALLILLSLVLVYLSILRMLGGARR
jgi:uncharacterized YccA/Bax inhibitor family protein